MSGIDSQPSGRGPRRAQYVYWGAVVGLIAALAALSVVVFFLGRDLGLSTGECTVLSCLGTLLLAQPAGAIGLLAGACCGAIGGYIGHRLFRKSAH